MIFKILIWIYSTILLLFPKRYLSFIESRYNNNELIDKYVNYATKYPDARIKYLSDHLHSSRMKMKDKVKLMRKLIKKINREYLLTDIINEHISKQNKRYIMADAMKSARSVYRYYNLKKLTYNVLGSYKAKGYILPRVDLFIGAPCDMINRIDYVGDIVNTRELVVFVMNIDAEKAGSISIIKLYTMLATRADGYIMKMYGIIADKMIDKIQIWGGISFEHDWDPVYKFIRNRAMVRLQKDKDDFNALIAYRHNRVVLLRDYTIIYEKFVDVTNPESFLVRLPNKESCYVCLTDDVDLFRICPKNHGVCKECFANTDVRNMPRCGICMSRSLFIY